MQIFLILSGNCGQVMSDGYHITDSSCSNGFPFDNFVFEVKMTINQGDCGGMILRFSGNSTFGTFDGYTFYVCSDGTYQFSVGAYDSVLKSGSHAGITSGQNTIAVVASDSNFILYLNHIRLDSVSDSSAGSGNIGLIAHSTNSNTTEVTYRDARVWTL